MYSDAGLCGVNGVVSGSQAPAYIEGVASALAGSANITAEELTRAKNMLKTNLSIAVHLGVFTDFENKGPTFSWPKVGKREL